MAMNKREREELEQLRLELLQTQGAEVYRTNQAGCYAARDLQ